MGSFSLILINQVSTVILWAVVVSLTNKDFNHFCFEEIKHFIGFLHYNVITTAIILTFLVMYGIINYL